ncbi:hypothetical protein [Staphylococcus epidermidis]|uniref:hypothetical protein n=1 Tax=Staphylococcus epidermidis TaxID=1282 RepID=UPI0011A6010A|nr:MULTISPECIES: hypothetical protein [Terrabacteria group]MBT2888990.1 hypothetical protein [Streptomyces sp. McG2]MDF1465017.1 hypothetical protein [Staphylococcus epidermidis]
MRNLNYENELDPIVNEEETNLEDFYELIFKDKSKKELVFKNLVSNDYLLSEVTEDILEDIENTEFGETYILNKEFMKNPRKPSIEDEESISKIDK